MAFSLIFFSKTKLNSAFFFFFFFNFF